MKIPITQKLIKAYHGTIAEDFTQFEISGWDIGIHFGNIEQAKDRINWKKQTAKNKGKKIKNERIISAYLAIKNPLKMNDLTWWLPSHIIGELKKRREFVAKELEATQPEHYYFGSKRGEKEWATNIRNLLIDKGYDGIVYENQHELPKDQKSYIIFNPEQASELIELV